MSKKRTDQSSNHNHKIAHVELKHCWHYHKGDGGEEYGFSIGWVAEGLGVAGRAGVGELNVFVKDGKLCAETEGMSHEFSLAVLTALLDKAQVVD